MLKESIEACLARRICGDLFVRRIEEKQAVFVFSDQERSSRSVPSWKDELASYCQRSNLYPATIGFDGSDAVFALGTNYDEAGQALGACTIFNLPVSRKAEDVVRDRIALAIDCPDALTRIFYEMGAFLALVGPDSESYAASLNWEACITLARSYERSSSLVDSLCQDTGGADFVIEYFPRGITIEPDIERMLSLQRKGYLFALVDTIQDQVFPSYVRQVLVSDEKDMMFSLCSVLRTDLEKTS